ncbi:cation diffusion facilitator family transporter [Micrococcales bacterium 31B]|nr:cation diffusion facilitator family transporter [Micrococcales bacterium 31B]
MSSHSGTSAIIKAFIANLGIAILKFIAFLISGATSMLAESVHSLADSTNQVLLLVGGKRAKRAATDEHPFGYGRDRYIYAFIVAIILFSVGGVFAIYEGIHKVQHPEPIETWWLPVAVLVGAIGLETWSFKGAIDESNKVRGRQAWTTFIRRSKSPELPVVLLEDFAALVGLVLALVGVGVSILTGNGLWDGIGTISIGVLLVVVAIVLGIETKSLLLGEGATDEDVATLHTAISGTAGVERIIHMKTLYLGPEELLVAAKIAVPAADSAAAVAAAIDAAEKNIRAALPVARVIYLEPDVFQAGYVAAERPEAPAAPSH